MAIRALNLFCCVLVQIQVFSQVTAQSGETKTVSSQLGAPCETDSQCTNLGDGVICSDGICACQDGFHLAAGVCLFIIDEVWKECNSRTQLCYLKADGDYQNVYCKSVCFCNTGFTASRDNRRCIANVETNCVVSSTCTENAECVDSECRCNSDSVVYGHECRKVTPDH